MHKAWISDTLLAEVAANRKSTLSVKSRGMAWQTAFHWVPPEPPKDSIWEPGIFEVEFEPRHQAPT